MMGETERAEAAVLQRAEAREAYERAQLVEGERRDAQEARMRKSKRKAEGQAQRFMAAISERLTLRYVRGDQVEEAEVQVSLDRRTLRALPDFAIGALDCGAWTTFPGKSELQEVALDKVRHPTDLEAFRADGVVACSPHGEHEATLTFSGLKLADLGIEPCVCAPKGPGHRYLNGNARINLGSWKLAPGERFDAPPGSGETLASFLKAGYVKDTQAPEEPVEEIPEKLDRDLLDADVETLEEVLESRQGESD